MKLFPTFETLESVEINIIWHLSTSRHGFQYISFILDHATNLIQVVLLRPIRFRTAVQAILDHWSYWYGSPITLVSDIKKEVTSNLFESIFQFFTFAHVFTHQ